MDIQEKILREKEETVMERGVDWGDWKRSCGEIMEADVKISLCILIGFYEYF